MKIRTYIEEAKKNKTAIGHFNISNLEMFKAVLGAVEALNKPVFIGVSEGEREYFGIKEIVSLVKLKQGDGFPIFLNADHTYSYEGIVKVVDAGFDSVIFDGTSLSMDENIEITKKCVEYARQRDVLVEGELGYIGKSSKMLDALPGGIKMTTLEDARRYVDETKVDFLAPAVGNIHGMLKSGGNPKLDIKRIKDIKEAVSIPLVLHGGSGISDADFKSAIQAGVNIIHVSTEIRRAYRKGMEDMLINNPEELAPYRMGLPIISAVQEVVSERMNLFQP
mgnify:CR=1 FL=1